jgi:AcrR family transcriptional regulator
MSDLSGADGAQPVSSSMERVRIVEGLIGVLRTTAFHEVTFETVGAALGLAADDVRTHFPSWDGLVLVAIDRWNQQRTGPLQQLAGERGAVLFLRAIVAANVADPALMRFLTATLNIAATPGHPLAAPLQQRWYQFQLLVQQSLVNDIAVGREPATMRPERGAEQLIALYEGLQVQSMVRPRMNVLEAYDRAVTRLREGWKVDYVPPVWDVGALG